MTKFTYGRDEDGLTFDFEALPEASRISLVTKGLNHFFGNECASKVTSAKQAAEEKGEALNDVQIAALKMDFQKAALQALLDGTVGHSARGPRATPIESIMRTIAEGQIRNLLKDNNMVMPTGDKTIKTGTGEFTRAQLIDRRLAHPKFGEAIRKEAEAKMAADARATKRTLNDAGGNLAAALGLDV